MNSSGSEQGSLVGCCEYGNELSGSTKGVEFLEYMRKHQLLEMDSGQSVPTTDLRVTPDELLSAAI
jgi:hypothetical protein